MCPRLHEEDPSFLKDIWSKMRYNTYPPDEIIVQLYDPATQLIVVVSGEMTVYVETDKGKSSDMCVFRAGDFVGDFALLGDEDWGSSTLISVRDVNIELLTGAENFVVCLVLQAADFQDIINEHSMEMLAAIESFKNQRWEHERQAGTQNKMVNFGDAQLEGKSFARSTHLILRWGHVVAKLIKKRRIQGDMSVRVTDKIIRIADAKSHMKQDRSTPNLKHHWKHPVPPAPGEAGVDGGEKVISREGVWCQSAPELVGQKGTDHMSSVAAQKAGGKDERGGGEGAAGESEGESGVGERVGANNQAEGVPATVATVGSRECVGTAGGSLRANGEDESGGGPAEVEERAGMGGRALDGEGGRVDDRHEEASQAWRKRMEEMMQVRLAIDFLFLPALSFSYPTRWLSLVPLSRAAIKFGHIAYHGGSSCLSYLPVSPTYLIPLAFPAYTAPRNSVCSSRYLL